MSHILVKRGPGGASEPFFHAHAQEPSGTQIFSAFEASEKLHELSSTFRPFTGKKKDLNKEFLGRQQSPHRMFHARALMTSADHLLWNWS